MKSIIEGYQRPGISALTVVAHEEDLEHVEGWLEATLPHVEQVVLAFIEAAPPPTVLIPHSRVRVLTFGKSCWKWFERMTQYHDALARLAEHQWSVFIDIHRRVTPIEFQKLREVARTTGPHSVAIRFSDNLITRANLYKNRLWRTNWDLRADESGHLVSLHGDKRDERNYEVIDHLTDYPCSTDMDETIAKLQEQLRQPLSYDEPIIITGMHRAGTSMLSRMINLLGVNLGQNLLGVHGTPDPTNPKGHWEDIACIEANKAIIREAIDYPTEWEWMNPVCIQGESISNGTREVMRHAIQPLQNQGRWGFKDPRNCITLQAWCEELGRPTVIVGVRNPVEVARSLYTRNSIPYVDGIRTWYEYYSTVLKTVAQRNLRAIFVDYEINLADPVAQFQRLAHCLEIQLEADSEACNIVQDFVDPALRRNRFETPSVESLKEIFQEEAIHNELEAIVELYRHLQTFSQFELTSQEPETGHHSMTVIARHRGDEDTLNRFTQIQSEQENNETEWIFLTDTEISPPPASDLKNCKYVTLSNEPSGNVIQQIIDQSEGSLIVFTDTRVQNKGPWLKQHREAHRMMDFPIALSGTRYVEPKVDADPFMKFWLEQPSCIAQNLHQRNSEPLCIETFPSNWSITKESLNSIQGFSSDLGNGCEFIDVVRRLIRNGVSPLTSGTIQSGIDSYFSFTDVLEEYRQFSKFTPALFSTHPELRDLGAVRAMIKDTAEHKDQLEILKVKLPDLSRAFMAQRVQSPQGLHKLQKHYGLAMQMAGGLGFLESDARVVRILGKSLSSQITQTLGESWNGRTAEANKIAFENNVTKVRSLKGKHQDETIFVMGCSPQLNEMTADQMQALSQRVTVGVNDCYHKFVPTYLLSSYFSEISIAQKLYQDRTTIMHVRPFLSAPLMDGMLTCSRKSFTGALPLDFGESLELLTKANVILLASHFAAILGAKRIAYIGVEMKTLIHYYQDDPSYIPKIKQAFIEHGNSQFVGIDHEYVRPHTMTVDKLCSAERMANRGNHFNEYGVLDSVKVYFEELNRLGIEVCVTTSNSRFVECGTPVITLDQLLGSER
jgi:hypothetical protein